MGITKVVPRAHTARAKTPASSKTPSLARVLAMSKKLRKVDEQKKRSLRLDGEDAAKKFEEKKKDMVKRFLGKNSKE